MLLVKLDEPSERARYIIRHMLEGIGGIPVRFVDGPEFDVASGPKLTYGRSPTTSAYHVPSNGWTADPVVKEPVVEFADGEPLVFPAERGADPFAVAFYLLSLADEMRCTDRDEHGRVRSGSLFAVRERLSEFPYVDSWAMRIARQLEERWPGLIDVHRRYTHTVTVDMDNILRYRGRSLGRAIGASARELVGGAFGALRERWVVRCGAKPDPFLAALDLLKAHRAEVDRLVLFFLTRGGGRYDHAASLAHPDVQRAFRQAGEFAEVGVHPSYHASERDVILQQDVDGLRSLVGKLDASRQHFLRWDLPRTLRSVGELGVAEEHSLGFSDRLGFRASTCTPFPWFDLENDRVTALRLVPFATMDSALIDHVGRAPGEVVRSMAAECGKVRAVKGQFVSVWHDRFLSGHREFAPWPAVFQQVLQLARP